MADLTGQVISNETLGEVIQVLPPSIAEPLSFIISLLKIVGVAALIYLVYLIVDITLNVKRLRRLKVIEQKIDQLDADVTRVLALQRSVEKPVKRRKK